MLFLEISTGYLALVWSNPFLLCFLIAIVLRHESFIRIKTVLSLNLKHFIFGGGIACCIIELPFTSCGTG